MNVAMIPARMGSQRLKQKNLATLDGISLLARAIRKCKAADCFDEIWVNSEHDALGDIATAEGVQFHKRPEALANDTATSEDFVYEFMHAHPCDRVFQIHTIAPLFSAERVAQFVHAMSEQDIDVLLTCTHEQIECAYQGQPINFSYEAKTNSQDLDPIQRITWSATGWRRDTFMAAHEAGQTATYAGDLGYFPVNRMEGHIIKTEEDLRLVEVYLALEKSSTHD